jgi:hypothetical protein
LIHPKSCLPEDGRISGEAVPTLRFARVVDQLEVSPEEPELVQQTNQGYSARDHHTTVYNQLTPVPAALFAHSLALAPAAFCARTEQRMVLVYEANKVSR